MTSPRLAVLFALSTPVVGCYSPTSQSSSSGAADDVMSSSSDDSGTGARSTTAETTGENSSSAPETESGTAVDSDESGATSVCGDGEVGADEVCDDGVNDGSYGGCSPDCTELGPRCGDGEEQADEVCDDGDEIDGDGCNHDCVVSGSILWSHVEDLTGSSGDAIRGLAILPEDEIIAVGEQGVSESANDAWLRRYGADGSTVWTETYQGPSGDFTTAYSVASDASGDIYVAGTYEGISDSYNGWVRKYDGAAEPEYLHTFSGAADGYDLLAGVAVSADGYAVAVGSEDVGPSNEAWIRRLGQDGSEFWTRSYEGDENAQASAVAIDPSGDVVVVGWDDVGSSNETWIRKYTADGAVIWTEPYPGPGTSNPNGVAVDSEGRITLTGFSLSTGNFSLWVRQLDSDGDLVWTDSVATDDDDYFPEMGWDVAVDAADNVVVVGSVTSADDTGLSAWVRKYEPDGDELWTRAEHVGIPQDFAESTALTVAIDSQSNIIVAGSEKLDDEPAVAWIRKLAP